MGKCPHNLIKSNSLTPQTANFETITLKKPRRKRRKIFFIIIIFFFITMQSSRLHTAAPPPPLVNYSSNEIQSLPLTFNECLRHSRKRNAYHAFTVIFRLQFNELTSSKQQAFLEHFSVVEKRKSTTDDDSSSTSSSLSFLGSSA